MKTNKIILFALMVVALVFTSNANCKKSNFQKGEVYLQNGNVLQGNIMLKRNYSSYELVFKKNDNSTKWLHISINEITQFKMGNKTYLVTAINTEDNSNVIAVLERVAGNDAILYNAKIITKKLLGKNNHTYIEKEIHLLSQDNQYVILDEKNYKMKLKEFWADEQKYLDKLTQYNTISKNELIQILLD